MPNRARHRKHRQKSRNNPICSNDIPASSSPVSDRSLATNVEVHAKPNGDPSNHFDLKFGDGIDELLVDKMVLGHSAPR